MVFSSPTSFAWSFTQSRRKDAWFTVWEGGQASQELIALFMRVFREPLFQARPAAKAVFYRLKSYQTLRRLE